VRWCKDRYEILDRAAMLAPDDGLILEFGVASGSTLRFLAKLFYPRKVYGFDSFQGLPEAWGNYRKGHFACDPPLVPSNVELVVGMFDQTLGPFLDQHPGKAALVHLDCDLYDSTKTVLDLLTPRIVAGTVVVCDEFWICEDHERRAFEEWALRQSYRLDSRAYEQAVMVIGA